MFIRGRYGHGGRLGYDREWRADPKVAGGGELLDQGVHLIDLARWFLGDFAQVQGCAPTFFWDMPVEDNGFLLLRTAKGRVAWLHASCTEWKNLVSFEIYGREGKLHIEGLGGSYGVERLAYYHMLPQMGPPETTIWEYPGEGRSWELELMDFESALAGNASRAPGLADAFAALDAVEQIYRNSKP
jgi:predicted dehydrogenase